MNRRRAIFAFLGGLAAGLSKAISAERIVVVYDARVAAYAEALDGIRAALGRMPATVHLDQTGAAEAPRQVGPENLVIAVGVEALRAMGTAKAAAPFISAMVLRSEAAAARAAAAPAAEVLLDTPLPLLLERLHGAFPKMTRLGVIRNPAVVTADGAALTAQARQRGFTTSIVECRGPAELLPAVLSLKGKVDLVLCSPDGSLYNSVTVKPLIIASLENRLPLVGFSANFVRAGAALGVYPDFVDIGRQAGEVALRYTPGSEGRLQEQPRKVIVSVNQSVFRLLGLERPEDPGVVVYR